MCFILATSNLTPDHLEIIQDAWPGNSDGAGIAAYQDRLRLIKPMMKLAHLMSNMEKLLGNPAIVHLRQATHGAVSGANCHPFWTCNKKALLAHNGIMPQPWAADRNVSDSRRFAETLMHMTIAQVEDVSLSLEKSIGAFNKVVIMDALGQIFFLNKEAGHQVDSTTWCSANPEQLWWRFNSGGVGGACGYGHTASRGPCLYDAQGKFIGYRGADAADYDHWWEKKGYRRSQFTELEEEDERRIG